MRIGIYGGTFDPPHLGHMESARAALDIMELDRLLLIPAGLPPHKALPSGSAAEEHRLAMTALMADGLLAGDRAQALDLELRREGPSFTADTLASLRQEHPRDELFLLMGGDMFRSFLTWHRPERILSQAGLVAFARTPGERAALEEQKRRLERDYGARITLLDLPQVLDISSTEARALLTKGEGQTLLWPPVYGYILRNGLYGTKADLRRLSDSDLRAVSFSMIKAKRIAHVKGTEQAARALALRWGEDPEQATRAAILHDCTKYLSLEEQLKLCEKYDILLDDLEKRTVKLLHSKTGAALARHMFGEPEAVCRAISWHTTGRAGMSGLEKILYLADYMEPTRDFDGVQRLRTLAEENLDDAVSLGLEMTVEEMRLGGQPVHPNTIGALEWLKGFKQKHG